MKLKVSDKPIIKDAYNSFFEKEIGVILTNDSVTIKRYWWIWIFTLAVAFLVQFLTIEVLLLFHKDATQIIDYGRLVLDPHSNWAVTWRLAENKPIVLWSYLGPLIAELSFQLGSPSSIGPRIASLLGGLAAGTFALSWLLIRRVPVYAAFCLSLAFMLDPLFVLSQRMGRLDSWVVALSLASCWLLRRATIKECKSFIMWHNMAAGGFAAAAALIWPSAIFLYPLIIYELFQLPKLDDTVSYRNNFILSRAIYFSIGGLVVFVLLLIPIWQNLIIIFSDMAAMVTNNIDSSKTFQDRLFSLFNIQLWLKMIKVFVKTLSPIFPLLAIAGAMLGRDKGLVMSFFLTIYMIFASLVYEVRILYLLPYFLVLGSSIFKPHSKTQSNLFLKKVSNISLIILTTWSVGISLIIRTALGFEGRIERDPTKIYQVASSAIGKGSYKVFLGFTYDFYFVGRSLDWRLYTPYVQTTTDKNGNWLSDKEYEPKDKFVKLLSKMDYAIFSSGSINKELNEQLFSSGLHYKSTLRVGSEATNKDFSSTPNKIKDILLWYLRGPKSYGSFVLYARDKIGKGDKVTTKKSNLLSNS